MEIPLATCPICKDTQPVLILETDMGPVVGCTVCKKIISKDNDIKVEYYDPKDIHKVTKWKFTEPGA